MGASSFKPPQWLTPITPVLTGEAEEGGLE